MVLWFYGLYSGSHFTLKNARKWYEYGMKMDQTRLSSVDMATCPPPYPSSISLSL